MQNSKFFSLLTFTLLFFLSGCQEVPQLHNTKLSIYTIDSESITTDEPNAQHLLEIERDFQGPQKNIELYRFYIDGQFIGNYDIENVTRDEDDLQLYKAELLLRDENTLDFSKVGSISMRLTPYGEAISGGKLRYKKTTYSLLHPVN